jgi:hypothetical protein
MKIHSIGISFSDNDFGSTLRPLTFAIMQMIIYRDDTEFTEESILELIKKTIGSFYLMYQADDIHDEAGNNRTIEYLEEYPVEVFLNEEVEDYLIKNDYWDNGEFYYYRNFPQYSELVDSI